ncbi:MAG TPA: hypothetical protein VI977_01280 [archaeon]|nr:hypothetical protein [archaeon]
MKKIITGILIAAIFLTFGCLSSYTVAKPDVCEKISLQETKEQCYWESAAINRDSALCEKISNSENRDLCYKDIATGSRHFDNAGIANID